MEWPSGIVTFLFTDIVGSTSRWDEARAEMESAMVVHDEIVGKAIADHNGRVVKKTGDGFMAAFADPLDAVSAALDAQALLGAAEWDTAVNLITVRMGVHTGPGTPIDGDYLGPSVNRAARIEAAGHGGQILVSAATRELVANRADGVRFRNLGQHHLRGFSRSEGIYQVDSSGTATSSHRYGPSPHRATSPPDSSPLSAARTRSRGCRRFWKPIDSSRSSDPAGLARPASLSKLLAHSLLTFRVGFGCSNSHPSPRER